MLFLLLETQHDISVHDEVAVPFCHPSEGVSREGDCPFEPHTERTTDVLKAPTTE